VSDWSQPHPAALSRRFLRRERGPYPPTQPQPQPPIPPPPPSRQSRLLLYTPRLRRCRPRTHHALTSTFGQVNCKFQIVLYFYSCWGCTYCTPILSSCAVGPFSIARRINSQNCIVEPLAETCASASVHTVSFAARLTHGVSVFSRTLLSFAARLGHGV
jgi:hypothetical protein